MSKAPEIFRGKRVSTGKWVEGFLVRAKNYHNEPVAFIINHCIEDMPRVCWGDSPSVRYFDDTNEVDPETVGQDTGIRADNGLMLCDGNKIWSNSKILFEGREYNVKYYIMPGNYFLKEWHY